MLYILPSKTYIYKTNPSSREQNKDWITTKGFILVVIGVLSHIDVK